MVKAPPEESKAPIEESKATQGGDCIPMRGWPCCPVRRSPGSAMGGHGSSHLMGRVKVGLEEVFVFDSKSRVRVRVICLSV